MMEGDGKCRAEAEARGLPANTEIGISQTKAGKDKVKMRETDAPVKMKHKD